MKRYEIKNIEGGVLDVDDKTRRVKTAWNKATIKDSDKDIIERTAFDKTIKERGPKAKDLIWHLTDHNASLKNAVGKPKELMMEGELLVAVTDIPNTTWGNDVLEFYKTGAINQHSIGFRTIKREVFNDDDWEKRYTIIKEVLLFEGSAVLWGANEYTPTLSVGKSLQELTPEEITDEYAKTMEELGKLHKMFKSGHLSDESYELIEMKVSQLTDKLQQLFIEATQPAVKAVEPEKNGLLDVLKTFNNNLNGKTENERARIESAA